MLFALYTSTVIVSIGLMLFLVGYLVVTRKAQVMLCTECQQCKAVCPMLAKGCNPVDIMLAAKTPWNTEALKNAAASCIGCGKCERACPRGLSPCMEAEKWNRKSNNPGPEVEVLAPIQDRLAA